MKKLNCWELVKPTKRQRRDIKPKRERGENRKNSLDGISLNPKCSHKRKSAAKPRNRKAQRLGKYTQACGSGFALTSKVEG